jgi:hypothetical protein
MRESENLGPITRTALNSIVKWIPFDYLVFVISSRKSVEKLNSFTVQAKGMSPILAH